MRTISPQVPTGGTGLYFRPGAIVQRYSKKFEISVDGQEWRPLFTVPSGEDWSAIDLDLSPWLGRTIALRFVTPDGRARPAWLIKEFRVEIRRQR
jgi:hypothetical protein